MSVRPTQSSRPVKSGTMALAAELPVGRRFFVVVVVLSTALPVLAQSLLSFVSGERLAPTVWFLVALMLGGLAVLSENIKSGAEG